VTPPSPGDATEPIAAIPGWYGKLPTLGDFASRRLPAEFITPWDGWLQQGLHAAQSALGEGWLQRYLTTPIWRFALLPGLVGASGWAGVLMPSVDRVGRYFPLTLAVPLQSHAALAEAIFAGSDWFAGLEEAALAMLGGDQGPDELDTALARRQFMLPRAPVVDGTVGEPQALPSVEAFESIAKAHALAAWSQHEGWRALWWTRGRVDQDPLMLASAGLPTDAEFARLLESGKPSDAPILDA